MSLTDEQIGEMADQYGQPCSSHLARAIESATSAPLLERIKTLVSAIDEEMVVSHLGVFNEGDDPSAAIKKLMLWSQGVGEYFAKERITELEQQLEAARKDAGWRPIESAPKDGTDVLLHGDGRTTFGHWCEPSDKPTIKYRDGFAPEPEWEEFEPFWASWDGGFTDEHPPTHWMPLPQSPADAAISKEQAK